MTGVSLERLADTLYPKPEPKNSTAYGTKLLVARETGSDTDFVDILTVYKGYSIEFVMTPNPEASVQELTDAQIQMCVDFLSELDFVEVK